MGIFPGLFPCFPELFPLGPEKREKGARKRPGLAYPKKRGEDPTCNRSSGRELPYKSPGFSDIRLVIRPGGGEVTIRFLRPRETFSPSVPSIPCRRGISASRPHPGFLLQAKTRFASRSAKRMWLKVTSHLRRKNGDFSRIIPPFSGIIPSGSGKEGKRSP